MNINFKYKGSAYKADLEKEGGNKIVVKLNDNYLGKQFGSSFYFSVKGENVSFDSLNPAHSELFALQSTIKNAIVEQAKELL
jgi:hypothetical protein